VEAAKELVMAQKLFIGGLAFSTSTERLREVFAAAGQVESAAVVTDRDTGRSRGFGFVEMATAEEADQAIAQFNGKDVDGRQLRVEKASAGGPRNSGGGSSRGFGASSRGGRW
jgi:RNA recognition motif-containing protein